MIGRRTTFAMVLLATAGGCASMRPVRNTSQAGEMVVNFVGNGPAAKTILEISPSDETSSKADSTRPESAKQVPPERRPELPPDVVWPGDRLEVLYLQAPASPDGRITPGDRIRLELFDSCGDDADMSPREFKIPADGAVSFPYLGPVACVGRTIEEMSRDLTTRYRKFYVDPRLQVSLVESAAQVDDLRAAVRSAGSPLVLVAPDGTAHLPLIGSVKVAGLSFAELERRVSERYAAVGFRGQVAIRLASRPGTGIP